MPPSVLTWTPDLTFDWPETGSQLGDIDVLEERHPEGSGYGLAFDDAAAWSLNQVGFQAVPGIEWHRNMYERTVDSLTQVSQSFTSTGSPDVYMFGIKFRDATIVDRDVLFNLGSTTTTAPAQPAGTTLVAKVWGQFTTADITGFDTVLEHGSADPDNYIDSVLVATRTTDTHIGAGPITLNLDGPATWFDIYYWLLWEPQPGWKLGSIGFN